MRLKHILILIITVGFLFRFYKISTLPFPPNGDELAFGYYGWSLLHHGTDEYGIRLPLSFISIGDLKYPVLAYLNTIPALFFGLNEITTRFWSVFAGVILIPLVYKLGLYFFKDQKSAVLSAALMAVMPWALIESRLGYENLLANALIAFAIYFIFTLTKEKYVTFTKNKYQIAAIALLFLVSIFLYAAARIFIPAYLLLLILISLGKESSFKKIRSLLVKMFFAFTIVVFVSLLSPGLKGRSTEEMWKGPDHEELNRLEEIYVQAGKSPIYIHPRLTWLFHNKYKIAVVDFLKRYTDHFSFRFLFFEGESSLERLPDMGVLAYYDLLFLPVGLFFLIKKNDKEKSLLIVAWLLASPVASSLTFGGAHINRASMMIVPISLISGYGFANFINITKNKLLNYSLAFVTSIGVVYLSTYTLNQLFIQKPLDRPWYKEQVYKDVATEILNVRSNYDSVAVGDDDYIYFLFYGKIAPEEFIKNADITPFSLENNRWERINRYENIYFKMPFNCPKGGKLNVLYVCSGDEIPQNVNVIKTFYYLDYVPAYALVEFYPVSKMPKQLPAPPNGFKYMVDVENSINYPDGIIPKDFESLW